MATSPTRCASSTAEQLPQPGGAVLNGAPVNLAAAVIDDRHGVIIAGPIHPGGHTVERLVGQGVAGRLHVSLLAASPSGEAPCRVPERGCRFAH